MSDFTGLRDPADASEVIENGGLGDDAQERLGPVFESEDTAAPPMSLDSLLFEVEAQRKQIKRLKAHVSDLERKIRQLKRRFANRLRRDGKEMAAIGPKLALFEALELEARRMIYQIERNGNPSTRFMRQALDDLDDFRQRDEAPELRTPEEWCKERGLVVLDPDGWRLATIFEGVVYEPRGFEEAISESEFLARLDSSTVGRSRRSRTADVGSAASRAGC